MNARTKVPSPEMEIVQEAPAGANPVAVIPQREREPEHRTAELPPTSIAKIAGAVAAIMNEIGVVAKDGQNKFHNYAYARMEDVLKRLTPLMGKHGLVVFQTEIGRSMFDDDKVIAIQYAFTVAHSSGEVWPERMIQTGASRCRDSKSGFDDKSLNKAHTAARKYFLLSLFQIPTGEDDDADHEAAPTKNAKPRVPSPNDEPADDESRLAFLSATDLVIKNWTGDAGGLKNWWNSPEQKQLRRTFELTQDEVNVFITMIGEAIKRTKKPADAVKSAPVVPSPDEPETASTVTADDPGLPEWPDPDTNYPEFVEALRKHIISMRADPSKAGDWWIETIDTLPRGTLFPPDLEMLRKELSRLRMR